MEQQIFLILIDCGVVVKKLLLAKGRYLIGRSDDTDLMISSKDVSRHHAVIESDGTDFTIEDLKSTNGTLVNGKRVNKEKLHVGDEIMIGDYVLFVDDGSGKFQYPEETEIGRKGGETAIIEDKFLSIRQKLQDKDLRAEFKKVEHVVKKSRKRLASLANEDKLTGLYNRQYFDKMSKKSFDEAKERGSNLSVLFIDIDHFKKVNDTYGHKVGDDALRAISQLIMMSCRKSDFVARYGGEEIVVILPDTFPDDALKVGSEINSIIAQQTKKILNVRITVSVGVATYPDDGSTLKKILENADKALYKAKRTGRNKVCKFDDT